jgi:hypothetical protein
MNGLNQMIAQGGRPIQIESPLNQMAQFEQIRGAQQANQLRQAEMQQLQQQQMRENQLRDVFRRQGVVSPTGEISREAAFKGIDPGLAPELEEKIGKAEKSRLERLTAQDQATVGRMKLFTDRYAQARSVPEFKSIAMESLQDPVLGPFLTRTGVTPDAVSQKIDEVAMQNPQQALMELQRGAIMNADRLAQSFVERGTPSPLGKLQNERQTLIDAGAEPNDQRVRELNMRILKEVTPAGPSTVVLSGAQERQFEGELGKLQAKELMDSRKEAEDARAIIDTVNTGRALLSQGTLVGTGANFLTGFNNALVRAGLDFGFNDAAANTQAYAAAIGNNVGRIISLFGAGTGLSDADREFAKLIAGGNTEVTEAALRRILDINERAARGVIALHNDRAKNVKTNIPLVVDMPEWNIPPDAINFLRQNNTPANRRFFDQKYGKSAAKFILGE